MSFRTKYDAAVERNHSLLCVGLDPDPQRLPPGVTTLEFLRGVIEATADLVCCYKPNASFFEPDGAAGWETLDRTIVDGAAKRRAVRDALAEHAVVDVGVRIDMHQRHRTMPGRHRRLGALSNCAHRHSQYHERNYHAPYRE